MEEKMLWRNARDLLLERVAPVEAQRLPLEACCGRILARDVTAQRDVPPFDRSPYDGYAFRSSDTVQGDVTLNLTEEIPAGTEPKCPVTPGWAAKVLTGAPLPPGADAVTKFEETDFDHRTVTLHRTYEPGENIVFRGEDVSRGQVLAQAGQTVDAGLAGALAAQEQSQLWVFRRPRVGILTIGSELTQGNAAGAKIPDASRYALFGALTTAGVEPIWLGSPPDDETEIARRVTQALAQTDLVITTGGVSVGDYDLTPQALEQAGVTLLVQNLLLKPGGKSCFGCKENKLVTSLSGNPASAMTCFYAVVLPLVRKLRGETGNLAPEFEAKLGQPCRKGSHLPRLLRGRLGVEQGELVFWPAPQQGNGALHTLAGANALAEIPPHETNLQPGAWVRVCWMGG